MSGPLRQSQDILGVCPDEPVSTEEHFEQFDSREVLKSMLTRCGSDLQFKSCTNVQYQDSRGWSLLHAAVADDKPAAVESLLEASAEMESADTNGDTPLRLAIQLRKTDMIELLSKAGAECDLELLASTLEENDDAGAALLRGLLVERKSPTAAAFLATDPTFLHTALELSSDAIEGSDLLPQVPSMNCTRCSPAVDVFRVKGAFCKRVVKALSDSSLDCLSAKAARGMAIQAWMAVRLFYRIDMFLMVVQIISLMILVAFDFAFRTTTFEYCIGTDFENDNIYVDKPVSCSRDIIHSVAGSDLGYDGRLAGWLVAERMANVMLWIVVGKDVCITSIHGWHFIKEHGCRECMSCPSSVPALGAAVLHRAFFASWQCMGVVVVQFVNLQNGGVVGTERVRYWLPEAFTGICRAFVAGWIISCWFRVVVALRTNLYIGPRLLPIFAAVRDSGAIIFVTLVLLGAGAHALVFVDPDVGTCPLSFFWKSFIINYVGDSTTPWERPDGMFDLEGVSEEHSMAYDWLNKTLFFAYTFIATVIFYNMLIGILTVNYDRFEDAATALHTRALCQTVVDYLELPWAKSCLDDESINFLWVAQRCSFNCVDFRSGRSFVKSEIDLMKKDIHRQTQKLNTRLDEMQTRHAVAVCQIIEKLSRIESQVAKSNCDGQLQKERAGSTKILSL